MKNRDVTYVIQDQEPDSPDWDDLYEFYDIEEAAEIFVGLWEGLRKGSGRIRMVSRTDKAILPDPPDLEPPSPETEACR